MLYSEGDIIRAHNEGRRLHALVLDYLRDWVTYANGANDVTFKENELVNVRFHGICGTPDVPKIKVSATSELRYVQYDVFVEDESPADDDEDFSWGRSGHYETTGHTDRTYKEVEIPLALLLDDKDTRIKKMGEIAVRWKAKQAEEARQAEIKRLKDQLNKLEAL